MEIPTARGQLGDWRHSMHSTGGQILWGKNHKKRCIISYGAATDPFSLDICHPLEHLQVTSQMLSSTIFMVRRVDILTSQNHE